MTAADRIVGRRCETSTAAIDSAVTELVEECAPALDDDRVLVVPDAHYPFHASTGAVTNPDAVEVLIETLASRGTDVALWLPPTPWVEGTDCARYLGYEGVADRTGVETVDPADAETVERTVHPGERTVEVDLPAPLVEESVGAVPTLRTDPDRPLAAALVTTALGALGDPSADEIVAAAAAVDPAFVLLDGTYTYAGDPHRSRFLIAGRSAAAVDRAAAPLVGLAPGDVDYLAPFGVGREAVEGLDVSAVAAALPNESPEAGMEAGGGPAAVGYRLYARVTGDLVPPQFLGDDGD
jgi:uncharacterized protein (DUF362 family)